MWINKQIIFLLGLIINFISTQRKQKSSDLQCSRVRLRMIFIDFLNIFLDTWNHERKLIYLNSYHVCWKLHYVSCSSASVNGKSRLLHFDWLFQTFWHWQVLLSRYAETEHAKLIIIFEWSGPFVWADGRIYAHLLQSILYYGKGRCTNETCHLSDCATIIYVYSFKGKHFSLSICATYLFNGR